MKIKTLLWTLLSAALLLALPAIAEEPSPTLYFYRDGQAAPAPRPLTLGGRTQADAEALLRALLAGPTPAEQADGLTSALPPGGELLAVTVEGDRVTVDLRLPLSFLHKELTPERSDAIVEQVVKTLSPLGLYHVVIRAEDADGRLRILSDFLPRPVVPRPTVPPNDDPVPDRAGPAPAHVGQPPIPGQGQPQGALSGKTVWLSAGHGWYWSDTLNRWNTQRPNTYGLVEDFSNAEAVNYYLARYLWNAGADVQLVRERSMNEHEVIVDNDDGAPAYTETGSWTTSSTPGYGGGTYRYAISAADRTATATWTPTLPEAGWYAVWAWYREGTNRPTDVRYEIHHAGGVTTVRLSQEVHGQTWRYLGEYYFAAGNGGFVTLINQSDDPGQAVIADAIRFGGGLGSIAEAGGTSGEPRWEEAAKYWARYQGAPSSVWANDVTARPLYAEWESAKGYPGEAENAVYISWHTNAGGGTGTNTFIHSTEPTPGSAALQDWIHAELIADLRAGWNPSWVDRGQRSADFGELRELSTMPGVLLEVAFHDTEDPGDADDLKEPVFRQIAARAVYQGIVKFYAEREGTAVHLLPEPPTRLVARATGPGQVTLTWSPPPCCDGLVGDAATSYKVYHSDDGRAFDNGLETISPTLTLTGLPPGSLHFFRVTAVNKGGESFPTPVVAVRLPDTLSQVGVGEGAPPFLIVDGFDRLDQTALIPQWESSALGTARRMFLERMQTYDYAVEHAQSLAACGLAFDGAVNEAVTAGDVALADYAAVDWFVGEDSTADAALDDAERSLLAAYLDGGGSLLLSGSEIGYDLVEQGRDPAFYGGYLRAAYRGDDAETYDFGATGGIFEGVSGSFDDSTQGTYDVGYPDRLGAANGSAVVLTYSGGSGDGAAIAYAGDYRLVYVGFPLETVTAEDVRTALFCAAADFLLPTGGAGVQLAPDRAAAAAPGETVIYTHTLTNTGDLTDTFTLAHHSSLGWAVGHPPSITLGSGLTATLRLTVAVPADAEGGAVEQTVLTATSTLQPALHDTVRDTTTVLGTRCTPRLINPGFEQGTNQSVWQVSVSGGGPVLAHRDDLPPGIAPPSGDWLAWLGVYTPGITTTAALTQIVALPPGEPTLHLRLSWQAVGSGGATAPDRLAAGIYDLSGTLLADLFTVTVSSATWQVSEADLGPAQARSIASFAGQTVQFVLRAVSRDTAFFVDDVQLTTCGPPAEAEFRALWVDAYHGGIKTRQQIDELVETAVAGNFNALVVQVRRRGDTYYPSALDPWAPDADPTFDALAYLIERAHAAGLEVHAWATTLAIWGGDTPPAAPDHTFNRHGPGATGDDYWLMTSYNGEERAGSLYYLDPGHPAVADYTVSIYAELARNYDLDGLHLDRVRYPDNKGSFCQDQVWYCQDWGYNPVSVARFQAETGRTDIPDPLDEEWVQWRRDQVTALVRRIYLTVTAINPRLRVSAATTTSGGPPGDTLPWETRTPYIHHLQDWRGWLEEGILDLALPMVYRDEEAYAGQFDGWSEWIKDHQYGRGAVIGTGLYLNSVANSMSQWQRARQPSALGNEGLGICGYSYATPSNEGASRREFVNVVVSRVFTRPASTPTLPWKDAPTRGHLAGRVRVTQTQDIPLGALTLTLFGPQGQGERPLSSRTLTVDGSGWFGAVDLPPGDYVLAAGPLTTVPVTITVGAVSSRTITLPAADFRLYLPLVLRR